ncbi:hypothetical protein [Rhizobium paknamense]|uniref:Uncharacterized protein n=1 Tax=Rhizobium paknamense TaxID=1206817 RepID=A0ABU0I8C2_9HYPH|nr:hypothetical protein [Rhizobium paknamense]MDQ0454473.1 hypothetical protein [Rhizobium paknamense]
MKSFEDFRAALLGQGISHVWRGYGSAIFLEIGTLVASKRRNGEPGEPHGSVTVMIQGDWRVEDQTSIICGSGDDEKLWLQTVKGFVGRAISEVELSGRLPELAVTLDDGLRLHSFCTAQGQPEWTIFNNRRGRENADWLSVENGRLVFQSA